MFVLDTNIVSELRRARPHGAVVKWLDQTPNTQLHLAAPTIGEIQAGIEQTRRHDGPRASELDNWLDEVVATFNVLPMTTSVFRIWARMMVGKPTHLTLDAMIAATAVAHSKIVATRNVRDFALFDVATVDPFALAV